MNRRFEAFARHLGIAAAGGALLAVAACSEDSATGGIEPRAMADALHAVMEADRTVYTRLIVNRLQNEENLIKASEHWKDEKALVLPAQMFRYGAEMVAEKDVGFSYSLLSLWPVNKQNAPKTEVEEKGLKHVAEHKGENYYETEELGGRKYFTAVYADTAVATACVACHNNHKDSPRSDFELGDVMGGVVVRIPVGG